VTAERYVVLGLAPARSPWFRLVAQWANSGAAPVEFVKCVSAEEVRAHLGSGRPFSALLADGALPALDRDLVAVANDVSCPVLVVDDTRVRREWATLGVGAVLPAAFGHDDLLAVLAHHGRPVGLPLLLPSAPAPTEGTAEWRGGLVAVIGPGGTGASTVAIALAQALAGDVRHAGLVALADFALHAEQAMLHDAGDVVPGVQELAEAHRHGRLAPDEVRALTFLVDSRRYHLLLGLRRAHHWPTVRPRAFAGALDGLRRAFRMVVADVDADLEGEPDAGSADVEDRHTMARLTTAAADVVVVVGQPTLKGLHSLTRLLYALREHGVAPARTLPVLNRAPRAARPRAALTRALAELTGTAEGGGPYPSPLFLPERPVERALYDGTPLPAPLPSLLAGAVEAVADRMPAPTGAATEPERVAPGSLGRWAGGEAAV
jgi:Mrp family chromosome partitioning ATPase